MIFWDKWFHKPVIALTTWCDTFIYEPIFASSCACVAKNSSHSYGLVSAVPAGVLKFAHFVPLKSWSIGWHRHWRWAPGASWWCYRLELLYCCGSSYISLINLVSTPLDHAYKIINRLIKIVSFEPFLRNLTNQSLPISGVVQSQTDQHFGRLYRPRIHASDYIAQVTTGANSKRAHSSDHTRMLRTRCWC